MRDGGDWSENALRLVDARTVVRLNAFQVGFDDAARRDLLLEDGLLDPFDRGFLNLESHRARLCRLLRAHAGAQIEQEHKGQELNQPASHEGAA